MRETGDIERHMSFQRKEWRTQQVGWWAMFAFVAAALAGAFGNGPFARARAATGGGDLQVRYERLLRRGAETRLTVELAVPPERREIAVGFDPPFLERFTVHAIQPEPARVEGSGGGAMYVFAVAAGAQRITAVFDIAPTSVGSATIAVDAAGQTVSVRSFTYF